MTNALLPDDLCAYRDATLTAIESIRRFLQHVLPHRFVKVRAYGLCARSHRARLARARVLAALGASHRAFEASSLARNQPPRPAVDVCPTCHTKMSLVGSLRPRAP